MIFPLVSFISSVLLGVLVMVALIVVSLSISHPLSRFYVYLFTQLSGENRNPQLHFLNYHPTLLSTPAVLSLARIPRAFFSSLEEIRTTVMQEKFNS